MNISSYESMLVVLLYHFDACCKMLASYPAFPCVRFLSLTASDKNLTPGKAGYEASKMHLTQTINKMCAFRAKQTHLHAWALPWTLKVKHNISGFVF